MRQIVVEAFGGPEVLQTREMDTPTPGTGQVVVRVLSIGMNHADLMGRRGEYKLSTGDPPFTPGLEGGGVIEAVGPDVPATRIGERVVLAPQVTRPTRGLGGTYRSHYVCNADEVFAAPDALADEQLGAVWLSHLTAWGCLVWKHGQRDDGSPKLQGQAVALPAASSSVALAAAQVVKQHGGRSIGLTTSPEKADAVADAYDHVVLTHDADRVMRPWHRDLKSLTDGQGVDVFFDPVAAGDYLNAEIRCLAQRGVIYVYGLLGSPGQVDVTPLIRKHASIAGYVNDELYNAGPGPTQHACHTVLAGFADGTYTQRIAKAYPLEAVKQAHQEMQQGRHIGKMVLIP